MSLIKLLILKDKIKIDKTIFNIEDKIEKINKRQEEVPPKDMIKCYYVEYINLNSSHKEDTKNDIENFEKKYGKKVHYYTKLLEKGKTEVVYYTLEGLTMEEKLKFIYKIRDNHVVNRHLKTIVFSPIVYTPNWIQIDNTFVKNGK